jgi:hypothetical protein
MSNTSVKFAIALFMILTPPAASFARGGHEGGHAGFAAMGALSRPAGSGGLGNVPISGIARGPGNVGGINDSTVDPSGISNAARMTTLPQPLIVPPTLPGGSRNPAARPPMNVEHQALEEASGTHSQLRAGQVPAEKNLMNPKDPVTALDRRLYICRCKISAPSCGVIKSGSA